MSYCRWNAESDLYIYEHVDGGFRVHIKGNRGNPNMQFGETMVDGKHNEQKYQEYLVGLEYLTHPSAGETFTFDTIPEVLTYIEKVRGEGLICPEYAVTGLQEDLEQDTKPVTP